MRILPLILLFSALSGCSAEQLRLAASGAIECAGEAVSGAARALAPEVERRLRDDRWDPDALTRVGIGAAAGAVPCAVRYVLRSLEARRQDGETSAAADPRNELAIRHGYEYLQKHPVRQ